jgi:hypothetical protein
MHLRMCEQPSLRCWSALRFPPCWNHHNSC